VWDGEKEKKRRIKIHMDAQGSHTSSRLNHVTYTYPVPMSPSLPYYRQDSDPQRTDVVALGEFH
jgi:hypothetical protein